MYWNYGIKHTKAAYCNTIIFIMLFKKNYFKFQPKENVINTINLPKKTIHTTISKTLVKNWVFYQRNNTSDFV